MRWRLAVGLIVVSTLAGCASATHVSPVGSTPPPTASAPGATTSTLAKAPQAAPGATPTASAKPLAGRVIVVDPGHNAIWTKALLRKVPAGNGRTKPCNSSGTASNAGWGEHTYNWAQATALAAELRLRGAKVVLTRPNDKGSGPCVNVRAETANKNKADLIISIHADGSFAKGARGYHIITSTTMVGGNKAEATSKALARLIRTNLDRTTAMPRSTYIGKGTALSPRTDIATLNLSKSPGLMMEMGNMRSAADLKLLRSASFRQAAAVALAKAAVAALS
ncbi:MAG: N-acetylmuramoyl-L-alanine amidase [Propionibacteriaceae bacterium]|nr:N-acetylmuramoyl-L-alanine amidase [Propionibacteriaceae bacterium]